MKKEPKQKLTKKLIGSRTDRVPNQGLFPAMRVTNSLGPAKGPPQSLTAIHRAEACHAFSALMDTCRILSPAAFLQFLT